jgi:hypothetical protein
VRLYGVVTKINGKESIYMYSTSLDIGGEKGYNPPENQ